MLVQDLAACVRDGLPCSTNGRHSGLASPKHRDITSSHCVVECPCLGRSGPPQQRVAAADCRIENPTVDRLACSTGCARKEGEHARRELEILSKERGGGGGTAGLALRRGRTVGAVDAAVLGGVAAERGLGAGAILAADAVEDLEVAAPGAGVGLAAKRLVPAHACRWGRRGRRPRRPRWGRPGRGRRRAADVKDLAVLPRNAGSARPGRVLEVAREAARRLVLVGDLGVGLVQTVLLPHWSTTWSCSCHATPGWQWHVTAVVLVEEKVLEVNSAIEHEVVPVTEALAPKPSKENPALARVVVKVPHRSLRVLVWELETPWAQETSVGTPTTSTMAHEPVTEMIGVNASEQLSLQRTAVELRPAFRTATSSRQAPSTKMVTPQHEKAAPPSLASKAATTALQAELEQMTDGEPFKQCMSPAVMPPPSHVASSPRVVEVQSARVRSTCSCWCPAVGDSPGCRLLSFQSCPSQWRDVNPPVAVRLSQDTSPSPLAVGCLAKHCCSHCTTSDVYGTPVATTVNTAATIAFSNTVRAERSEDRHRVTPTGVLRHGPGWRPLPRAPRSSA